MQFTYTFKTSSNSSSFHLVMQCCSAYSVLQLCWSDKTQFMMDNSGSMVICFKYKISKPFFLTVGIFLPQIFSSLPPSFHLGFSSNITFSEATSMSTLTKVNFFPPLPHVLLSHYCILLVCYSLKLAELFVYGLSS